MSRAACKGFFIDLAELKKKIKRKTRETVQSLAGFCIYNPDPRNPDPCLMMATHSGAAASRAPATKPFFSGSGLFVSGNSVSFTHQRYSRTKLLDIKETADLMLPPELRKVTKVGVQTVDWSRAIALRL